MSISKLNNRKIRPHNIWFLIRHSIAFNIGLHLFTYKYQICLLENSDGIFITADQPIINIHGKYNHEVSEKIELYYPITPKLALIISNQSMYPDKQVISIIAKQ